VRLIGFSLLAEVAMPAPFSVAAVALLLSAPPAHAQARPTLDDKLRAALADAGFTGTIESTLETRLGRPLDPALVKLGQFLFFDTELGLHDDASCASCHSPTNGWGDPQPIAIGVQSNGKVGPDRMGPRNLRRSPMTANTAFYPTLMWDGRFSAPSGDPFDNSLGFLFPEPEGTTAFPPYGSVTHLVAAQAFIPLTGLPEMVGFTGTKGDPEFDVFDDGLGSDVPDRDASGFRHDPIRQMLLDRLNVIPEYVRRFSQIFPAADDGNIDFAMVGAALAEFQFSQTAADAPLDRYARGTDNSVLKTAEKKGALVYFGKGQCVTCHAVAGESNEMFSDFQNHVIAVPQVAPEFGVDALGNGLGNIIFDGANRDEDYGLERNTGDSADRYKFRTAPLRNLARSPAYFHNGAFTDLEDAIRHHLDVIDSATYYDPVLAGAAPDFTKLGPVDEMLGLVDPLLDPAPVLTEADIANLVKFVRDALLDPKSSPSRQCRLIPRYLPSGDALEDFQGCSVADGSSATTE
jgi:cytochrome c peroxidase